MNPKEGFIGVASLWTPREKIAPLMPQKVAVVGQLYTKAGIEYIIRNLWANPRVSCLVVCGEDRTGSGQALLEFFRKGTIGGQADLFDEKIPARYLTLLRKKVKLVDLRGETNEKKIAKKVAKIRYCPPFAKTRKIFPQAELPGMFPSETSLFRVESSTIGLAWLEILKTVLRFGWEIPRGWGYGGAERMVLNLAAVITGEEIKKPKFYPFFNFDKDGLRDYLREFFNPQRGEQAYTYGERIFAYQSLDQLAIMAKKLQQFPYNKGALAVLWQPAVDNFARKDLAWHTPCLTLIQGICREDKLHLTCYIRSNDMFGAWPQNAFALRKLQSVLAEKINKKVGVLTTISQSAFIDKSDLAAAQKIVEKYDQLFCSWDPRGNLVIGVEKEEIVVKHFSPDGRFLEEFRVNGKEAKAALKMEEKLLRSQVISRVDHALDIGEQLGRAEDAIKLGMKFEQDRPL